MRNMMGKLEGLIRQGLVAAVAASIVLGMAQSVQAADVLIVPVAATAESYYAGGTDVRSPEQAINGSGMAPNAPVIKTSTCDNTGFPEWLSNGIRYSWITFDLGSVQTITGFHLWNANQDGDGEIQRGVKTAGIYAGTNLLANGSSYTSAGAAWGTLVENMTFAQGTRSATYAGSDYIFATPVTTRFLQLYVTDNFAGADTYTGISEIRFYSSTPPILSIVANGDFSANAALFTDGASYFGGGNPESAPGWTGGSGIGGTLGSAPDYFGPVNGAIPSYLFMQGVKTVTQTITTTVGKAYLFSFKAACRQNCVVGLTVWADNTQAPNLTIADGGLSVTSFQTYSFVFTGSGVQTLQFVSSGTGDFAADVTDVAVTELDISSSVVNGDFSSNAALFTNGNSYFAAQSTGNPESAPGWTGGSGIGGTLGSAPDYFGPVNGAIPSYLFMQGAKTVTQTILTTVGTTYLLSFKAACRQGNVVGLTVWADNTKLPNLTIPDGGLSGTSFQTYSIMFTGSGVQTLQFVNSGTGDFTANVTDVAVTEEFGSPEAPVFTQIPQSQTVTNADSVTFTAQATGYPTPLIVWHFVDTNAVDHLLSTVGNTLTFTAKSADAGHYYAAASNSQGTTNSPSALLTVIPGQVMETDLSLSGGSFAPLAGNNLILGNTGSSTLSITGDGDGSGSASLLTDGDLGAPQTGGPLGIAGGSITYNLGSGANGMGYDITGIRSLSAWADGGRFKPKYAVSYSVDGLNFIPLWTVDYSTATGNGADVSLAITGLIKVTAIKFDFPGGQQNGWVSYRELAVFGRSTFPSGTVLMLY